MPEKNKVKKSRIALNSSEALWEWDIDADRLFFTSGAHKLFKSGQVPDSMADFYKLLIPETFFKLNNIHKEVIHCPETRNFEHDYNLGDIIVHEKIITLERGSHGKATRLLGCLSFPSRKTAIAMIDAGALQIHGLWLWNPVTDQIWHDEICAKILGISFAKELAASSAAFLEHVHPAERASLQRQFTLFNAGRSQGNIITQLIHIKNANGEYLPLLLHASSMERNEKGYAMLVAGSLNLQKTQASANAMNMESRAFHAMNGLGSGQWHWDRQCENLDFCPRYLAMLGIAGEQREDFSRNWRDFVHADDLQKLERTRNEIAESPDKGDSFECTYRMLNANGQWVWIFDRACVTWRDSSGRAGHIIGSITNISSAQAEREKLEDQVRNDPLTGLRSRAFCDQEIERIEKNAIRPVSVISVDVTGLKMVNDNLGHAAGDKMLINIARLLQNCLRASDCIARTGGDEFIILLPGCSAQNCLTLLAKIRLSFANWNGDKNNMPLFASCGGASADSMLTAVDELIDCADMAMYKAKRRERPRAHAAILEWIKKCTGKEACPDDRVSEV